MRKTILIIVLAFVAGIIHAQMYLDVTSPIKHLGSVASKDVVNDNAGSPCAKIMFEMSLDDISFTSSCLVGTATKKTGRYECFVSVPQTQGLDITITHPKYGSVSIPLWSDNQPLVSREAYHVKIESKLYESFYQKFKEGDGAEQFLFERVEVNGGWEVKPQTMHRTSIPEIKDLKTMYVSNMSEMFAGCTMLGRIDLSKFNTSNVTNMSHMFSSCANLRNLDLRTFNTSKVNNFDGMFCYCFALRTLDLKGFDTSEAQSMSGMFYGCENLQSLDLRSFKTSNVTDMGVMFYECKNLQSLNLSSFNTSNVTDMREMFNDCNNLEYIDMSNFCISQDTDRFCMFTNCNSLRTIKVTNCNQTTINEIKKALSEAGILNQVRLIR